MGAAFAFVLFLLSPQVLAHPHSPSGDKNGADRDYWIELGEAVHGSFGPLIAVGIRIGDDALKTLGVGPRNVDVTYYSGKDAPCPCAVDGIMLVTTASPGQGTLRVAAEPAADGQFGRVVIRHKRSNRAVEYVLPPSLATLVREAMTGAPERRWSLVMRAPEAQLFTRRTFDVKD
jgi:hypothetical protein